MSISLAKGVQLNVIPTEKYKTIRILVRFSTVLNRKTITKRTLLSSLMETNSLNYPTQVKLSEKLADLYGASFGISVNKKGNLHWLNISMNIVNDKYLNDGQVLSEAVDFLKEIIFSPNIADGQFEQETFLREKENMTAYLGSIAEDKQAYASLALQNLYFSQSEDQRIPSFGTIEDLAKEDAGSLAEYYQKMLTQDQVSIFVIGDVEESEIADRFKQLPFVDREEGTGDIFYQQPLRNVIEERSEQEMLAQSKLNLAYHTGVYYGDHNHVAFQVFNGIFGGFPHSKLFMNVREKENLAYYSSSTGDTFRGLMTVQTGIDRQNRDKVLHLVSQELDNIRKGEITEEEMAQTKAMLKNQYLLSLDNAGAILEKQHLKELLSNKVLSTEEWLRQMEAVTKEDVQSIARQVQLQAIFFLEGDMKNG